MKPAESVEVWKKSSALDRVQMCRVMLHLHGFLSGAENDRVQQRIKKWVEEYTNARNREIGTRP